MNEEEERVFEIGLGNQISYKEVELNKTIRKGAIKGALLQLEIIRLASQSQDPEVLEKGLSYFFLLWETMKDMEIKDDEIKSSKEEIRLLGNEIAQKLPDPDIPVITVVVEKIDFHQLDVVDSFKINLN